MKVKIYQKYKWDILYIFILICIVASLILVPFWKKKELQHAPLPVAMRENIMPMRDITEDDVFRWKNNSRYTLVVYTSLDCEHCRKLYEFIESRYDIFHESFNLIYRNAPLTDIEPLSKGKAILGGCLKEIEGEKAYFQFITELYKTYNMFQKDNSWAYEIAKKYTHKESDFFSCKNSDTMRKEIEKQQQQSLEDGVGSTPTLGIFFDSELVGRYAVSGRKAMQIVEYLSLFTSKADQFWSDDLLNEYLDKYRASH